MAMPRSIPIGEEIANDRITTQRRKRYRRDKLLAGRRDDHLNLRTLLHESTNQIGCLVSSDAPGYPEYDMFAFQHSFESLERDPGTVRSDGVRGCISR